MKNLSFDEGIKSFTINDDESRVIRFNPSDNNIMQRVMESQKRISEFQTELRGIDLKTDGTLDEEVNNEKVNMETAVEVLQKFNHVVREELNHIFNSDVYDIVFGAQSPLCVVRPGKFLFEAFLDAVIPEIEKEIQAANATSEKRIEKYTKEYHK